MWEYNIHVVKKQEKIINAVTKGKKPKTTNLKGGSYDKLDQAVYEYFLLIKMCEARTSLLVIQCLKRKRCLMRDNYR